MESLFLGAILRVCQASLQAAPTVLIGWLVAAIFQQVLGREGTYRVFGGSTWRQIPYAWGMGMLLPVCSLGSIPIMTEMRRAGIAGGTLLAFGLTAPIFNPISVLYGLTLSDPRAIVIFSLFSLLIVTVMGLVWDKLFPSTRIPREDLAACPYGWRRLASVVLAMARIACSRDTLWMLVGICGVGVLSCFLPAGSLQHSAEHQDPWAAARMAAIAIPVYATPMVAMVQLASMFQHGNSIAAAFTLLVLGTGINLGVLGWMTAHFRWYRTAMWLGILVGIVLVLAVAVDGPLYPKGVEPAGHTHAFDNYCAPFPPNHPSAIRDTGLKLYDSLVLHEWGSLIVVGLVLIGGAFLQILDPAQNLENSLRVSAPPQLKNDIVLPRSAVAGVTLAALVAASIGACYMYYPPKHEIFEETKMINAEVFGAAVSGDWDTALYWIPIYEDWLRKLQVGGVLRRDPLTPYQTAKLKILQDRIELLEHELEEHESEEAAEVARKVGLAYLRLRRSFPND